MKILIFDNYDSFTWNLVHLIKELGYEDMDIFRNDKISLESVEAYDKILLSPGPGIPQEAGNLIPLIQKYAASKSILGVCLGHQAIAEAFGGSLINLTEVFHGTATPIQIVKEDPLFRNISKEFSAGRYHSWVVDPQSLPKELEVLAVDENNEIMALRHKLYDVRGVQFHPESVMTPEGSTIIKNWLENR